MNVSSVKIKSYEQLTMNNEQIKQTQSFDPAQDGPNPTCSELACPELVEGVEPISNVSLLKWVITLHPQLNIQAKFVYNVFILR